MDMDELTSAKASLRGKPNPALGGLGIFICSYRIRSDNGSNVPRAIAMRSDNFSQQTEAFYDSAKTYLSVITRTVPTLPLHSADGQIDRRQGGRQTERRTDRQACRQTGRQTDRHSDRQTGRRTDRQPGGQTDG
jgi:hypothetical protein